MNRKYWMQDYWHVHQGREARREPTSIRDCAEAGSNRGARVEHAADAKLSSECGGHARTASAAPWSRLAQTVCKFIGKKKAYLKLLG